MSAAPARPGSPIEVEWQFDALDLEAVSRFLERNAGASFKLVPAASAQRLVDTYFDSADWRIGRGGFVLRERHRGRRVEVTMKDLAESDDGLRRRMEVTEPGPIASVVGEPGDGPVAWRLRALLGPARLRPLIEVVTRRRRLELFRGEARVAEIGLDETTITPSQSTHRLHLRRVEVEVDPAAVDAVRPLVEAMRQACALSPAVLSKFEAGLLAAGLTIPGPPELGPGTPGADPTVGELALVALRRDAAAMLVHEPGTRLGEDIEELHEMRVATRRLRAAFALFADALPVRAALLREEIGWLAGVLGAVRDLDVQLEELGEWRTRASAAEVGPLGGLLVRLETARQLARAELLEALDSRRYARLVSGLSAMLQSSTGRRGPVARTPATVAMPGLIEQRQRAAARAARRARRSGVAADFHRLRIRVKRLRYAIDFGGELYGASARRYAKALAVLQGELGAMQDAEVAAERLRALALGSDPLAPEELFVVGGMAERFRAQSEALLARLPQASDVLTDRRWRRFYETIERSRNVALAALAERSVAAPSRLAVVPGAETQTVGTPEASQGPASGEAADRTPPPLGRIPYSPGR